MSSENIHWGLVAGVIVGLILLFSSPAIVEWDPAIAERQFYRSPEYVHADNATTAERTRWKMVRSIAWMLALQGLGLVLLRTCIGQLIVDTCITPAAPAPPR